MPLVMKLPRRKIQKLPLVAQLRYEGQFRERPTTEPKRPNAPLVEKVERSLDELTPECPECPIATDAHAAHRVAARLPRHHCSA